jgi:branched-chain amino acid transport system ATP-binding protein
VRTPVKTAARSAVDDRKGTARAGRPDGRGGPHLAGAVSVAGLGKNYGGVQAVRDVSFEVGHGEIFALLGPNGAGKTTLLRVAAGLLSASAGHVILSGEDVTMRKPFERARNGICLIPESRGIFPNLSVRDNLRLHVPPWKRDTGYELALEAFPVLKGRLGVAAGNLSGGQQQMLALSRCFLSEPKIALLDEVSTGLAPRVIDEIFEAVLTVSRRGISLLLVEQYVGRALEVADRVYLLGRGTVTFSGDPSELDEAELMRRYVGAKS